MCPMRTASQVKMQKNSSVMGRSTTVASSTYGRCEQTRGVWSHSSRQRPKRQANPRLRQVQAPQPEVRRGTFKFVAAVSDTQFIALETGWENDMAELAEGLQEYAAYAKCGTDQVDACKVYACKDPASGQWRRCRKLANQADLDVVGFVDHGGQTVIAKHEVLELSQYYELWRVKAVDVILNGNRPAPVSAEDNRRVQDRLLNETFEVSYSLERTRPHLRDLVHVVDISSNGKSILAELVQQAVAAPTSKKCPELSSKLPKLESLVRSDSAQKMVADRVEALSSELRTIRLMIGRLCLSSSPAPATVERLKILRQAAQARVQDLEDAHCSMR